MGFFLTDWIQSALTPPGTHALQNQQAAQGSATSALSGLLPGAAGYQNSLQGFQQSQLPNLEQGVNSAYLNTTQGGRNAETQAFGAQQNAAARGAGAKAYSQFAGNPSLAQGYALDQQNQANTATSGYAGQINSPQGEQQAWNEYLGANQMASPNYQGVSQLNAGIQGARPVQVGQGLGQFLGQALGSYALGQLGGGGGSSGPSPYSAPAGSVYAMPMGQSGYSPGGSGVWGQGNYSYTQI